MNMSVFAFNCLILVVFLLWLFSSLAVTTISANYRIRKGNGWGYMAFEYAIALFLILPALTIAVIGWKFYKNQGPFFSPPQWFLPLGISWIVLFYIAKRVIEKRLNQPATARDGLTMFLRSNKKMWMALVATIAVNVPIVACMIER
jgi:hypothetical protein